MHHINKVSIEGFWETYEIDFSMYPHVTFLIGQNGTGKTTVINLVAAALTADYRTLDRIPFKKITISLDAGAKGNEPKIIVSKSKKKDRPFESIDYRVLGGGKNSVDFKFSLDDVQEQVIMRRYSADQRNMRNYYRNLSSGVVSILGDLVNVNWISVHRTPVVDIEREDASYESTVDQRLSEISNGLIRFFATLSGQKDAEVRAFQEYFFTSLLEQETEYTDHLNISGLESIEVYKQALSNIFQELHVSHAVTDRLISSFVKRGESVKDRFQERDIHPTSPINIDDVLFLYGFRRISAIVERWNKLQKKLSQIFSPRDKYLKICNDLFQRKTIELTQSNELRFISRTGKYLTPQMLSSGEKQLLILLSETLLQKEQKSIFIADEPELSLHVLWQEKLIGSLRSLNPVAQIIAATHSPDIVGPLVENVIDMETLVP